MKRKILIAILLVGAVVSAKCLTPSEPDFVTGKLMDAQNSKLVLEELNSKGIEYSREAAYDLANVLSQKSKTVQGYYRIKCIIYRTCVQRSTGSV